MKIELAIFDFHGTFRTMIARPRWLAEIRASLKRSRVTALAPLKGVVVIDEIQRRPDLFPMLRLLAD
ncbi:MAG: hypothetical protein ACE5PT_02545 [Gemmatimonadales bacterium]